MGDRRLAPGRRLIEHPDATGFHDIEVLNRVALRVDEVARSKPTSFRDAFQGLPLVRGQPPEDVDRRGVVEARIHSPSRRPTVRELDDVPFPYSHVRAQRMS